MRIIDTATTTRLIMIVHHDHMLLYRFAARRNHVHDTQECTYV